MGNALIADNESPYLVRPSRPKVKTVYFTAVRVRSEERGVQGVKSFRRCENKIMFGSIFHY